LVADDEAVAGTDADGNGKEDAVQVVQPDDNLVPMSAVSTSQPHQVMHRHPGKYHSPCSTFIPSSSSIVLLFLHLPLFFYSFICHCSFIPSSSIVHKFLLFLLFSRSPFVAVLRSLRNRLPHTPPLLLKVKNQFQFQAS